MIDSLKKPKIEGITSNFQANGIIFEAIRIIGRQEGESFPDPLDPKLRGDHRMDPAEHMRRSIKIVCQKTTKKGFFIKILAEFNEVMGGLPHRGSPSRPIIASSKCQPPSYVPMYDFLYTFCQNQRSQARVVYLVSLKIIKEIRIFL